VWRSLVDFLLLVRDVTRYPYVRSEDDVVVGLS
jgi:hypothetical protein